MLHMKGSQPRDQLILFQARPTSPAWSSLPTEVQSQVLKLLARFLRRHRRAPATLDAVCSLARICPDPLIANFLNRNGLRTGRGNFWTRERVTALRSHHGIPVYNPERRVAEGWLNLTEAARLIGVSARTLRLAVDHGEIRAEHPLDDGPWIFRRVDLQSDQASVIAGPSARSPVHRHDVAAPSRAHPWPAWFLRPCSSPSRQSHASTSPEYPPGKANPRVSGCT